MSRLVTIAARPEADRLWWELELRLVDEMPTVYREGSQGGRRDFDFLASRFRCANPEKLRRESWLLPLALLDERRVWEGVRRLVAVLRQHQLPARLSSRVIEQTVSDIGPI